MQEESTAQATPVMEERRGRVVVDQLAKSYRLWRDPSARLKGLLLEAGARSIGRSNPVGRAFQNRSSRYSKAFEALEPLSFTLEPGESVGIIGRNGSGKSTLLQMISGVLEQTSGRYHADGRVAALLALGSGFNPEFTGRENVFLNAALLGQSRAETEARFDEIAAFADIGTHLDQPVRTYSSGMALRLAFAVNVMVEPDILIIDEALAVGDIFFQQKCFRFLRERFKDRTRILVSHDMNALNTVVDRVLVLNQGKLLYDGPVRDGIALYVKLMQAETFGTAEALEDADAFAGDEGEAPAEDSDMAYPFRSVTEDDRSGRGEARFQRAALVKEGTTEPVVAAEPGNPVEIVADFQTARPDMSLLFGYMIFDNRGKQISGDTTVPLFSGAHQVAQAGRHRYHLRFTWPPLKPGDYTITIGIGEGSSGFDHIVQGWANHIFLVKAMSGGAEIHGVFANPIRHFECTSLDA